MEVSEQLSLQANSSDLSHLQLPSSDNGVPDPNPSEHHRNDDSDELGFPEPQASSNGDSETKASDLTLTEKVEKLVLKESHESSPKSDSEVIGDGSESRHGSEGDRNSKDEAREDSIENDRELEDEKEEEEKGDFSAEKELDGEVIDDRSESENVDESEAKSGGDELEKRDEKVNVKRYQYPVRPEAEDCAFYIKTGCCKFGSNCKFNHPIRKKTNHQPVRERVREREKEESSEKPHSLSECKFFMRSGGCRFGKACKYFHPRGKMSQAILPVMELNFLGLPIRVGEKECPFYMRTGSCKYGAQCRFNHPDPTDATGSKTPTGYSNGPVPLQGGSKSNIQPPWSSPRSLNETSSAPFVPLMGPPSQGASSQNSEWNGYQAPVYLPPERNMPQPPLYPMNNLANENNTYKHRSSQNQVDDYPERPGQPDCSYFLKTGNCKYRLFCKYNHPKSSGLMNTPCTLSDKGLPLRPDQNICAHYSRYGICKYGPACKYDHSPLASAPVISGGEIQPPYGLSATMDGDGMTRSGSRSEIAIQQ